MVTIWYPAADNNKPAAAYMPEPDIKVYVTETKRLLHNIFLHNFRLKAEDVKVSARETANIANGDEQFPILIFSPGFCQTRYLYTVFAEELASHGYIVVGVDHPYNHSCSVVFSDGQTAKIIDYDKLGKGKERIEKQNQAIQTSTLDILFALNQLSQMNNDAQGQFYQRLDLNKIGLFGHSAGGWCVTEVASLDSRVKAVVDLDGGLNWWQGTVVKKGLGIPAMFMFSEESYVDVCNEKRIEKLLARRYGNPQERDRNIRLAKMAAEQIKKNTLADGTTIVIKGMEHMNFSDAPSFPGWISFYGEGGKINVDRGHEIVNRYMLAFFDFHLKGTNSELLNGDSKKYPEAKCIKY